MLKNDPPPGTNVTFLTMVKSVQPRSIGKLIKPMQPYRGEFPDDEFEIEYAGQRVIVKRRDIE